MKNDPNKKLRAETIKRYLNDPKYKDMGSSPLSRIINKQNILLFNNIEAIRGRLKYYRGKTGERLRSLLSDKSNVENFTRSSDNTKVFNTPKQLDRLFFDIETSFCIGWFWRPSFKTRISYDQIIEHAKIICISYRWEYSDKTEHLYWDEEQCDKQLLKDFLKVANKADELVAHNGDKFDMKTLRGRCFFHRIPMFPTYKTFDTLKKSRTAFGGGFPSHALNNIGDFANLGHKIENERGLWKKVILNNDREALQRMVDYCDRDVELLMDVYNAILPYTTHNTHFGVIEGGDKWSCPNCASENMRLGRDMVTKAGTVRKEMVCNDCNSTHIVSNREYQNSLNPIKNIK